MISTVTGIFKKFDATLKTDSEKDFSDAQITFEADTASVDTKNEQRDTHLQNDDFFNAEKFPKLNFVSTKVEKISDEEYKIKGALTPPNAPGDAVTMPKGLCICFGK